MSLTVRVATTRDASAVSVLITLAYRVEDFFVHGDRTSADDVRARMQRGEFLMLEDAGGALAGCVYVESLGERGYMGMLSIDPGRQRQGLGARLVAEAEARCAQHGCREMEIEVVNLRAELPAFYHRLGYVASGTRPFPDPDRLKMPCHFVVMNKSIAKGRA
jgi:ribosomal protein S18 acetylase RimI-like enzyme